MPEVQDILRLYGQNYVETHSLTPEQHKAIRGIMNCRTSALGGHADQFDCGHTHISYNSCRNRHCPKCQALAKERWVMAREAELLPVPYFHIVFTLPSELDSLVFENNALIYDLLLKTSAETLKQLCLDAKFLGAESGFTSILHTWGQNLTMHPHVHMIVPAGGLTTTGDFVRSGKKFFIPVRVMSKKFRGKFLFHLKKNAHRFKLSYDSKAWQYLLDSLYQKDWYVYCKRPFKTASSVLKYLGRYTHRVAISNHRIVSIDNGQVSFTYRDYRDNSKSKLMSLPAAEFIRRFLLHVLPSGFMKIRHYGFLSPACKTKKLALCKMLTGSKFIVKSKMSAPELMLRLTGKNITSCPYCGIGQLIYSHCLSPPNLPN